MSVIAFLLLPDTEASVLSLFSTSKDFNAIYRDIVRVTSSILEEKSNQLFYNSYNLECFFKSCEKILKTNLTSAKNQLKLKWRIRTISVEAKNHTDVSCNYFKWDLGDFKIDYSNDILSIMAERIFKQPLNENHILINFNHDISSSSSRFYVFKDAHHKLELPNNFAQIPFVENGEDLITWLATYKVKAFSLLDRRSFTRTNFIQQGQTAFRENSTGNLWYLDNLHKNHYEVFNSIKQHLGKATLEGELIANSAVDGRTM